MVHTFTGKPDGSTPWAGLLRDSQGNLYGTTEYGGTSGQGTAFKITTTGVETVLHSFAGGADGANPLAGLAQDASGNLYGTTTSGGAHGYGVVFKITTTGVETVLHNFTNGTDGGQPEAGLVRDASGNLYGTTELGGGSSACNGGCGVVFKMTTAGTETVLHTFTGKPDGAYPVAGLILDASGNLYGTTCPAALTTTAWCSR